MSEAKAATPRPALVWPFRAPSNRYIELHKLLLAEIGYEPRPLMPRELLRGDWRLLLRRDTLVTLHWFESAPFRPSGRAVSVTGWLSFGLVLTLLWMLPARSAYFVHNHAVHDARGAWKALSERLIRLLCRVTSLRVVHDPGPSAAAAYGACYLPHPLYWDAPGAAPPARKAAGAGQPRLSVLGSIRPYKRLDELLEHWPAALPLLIAGRCAPDYEARLRAIIERRRLAPLVRLDAGFLDEPSFAERLDATDVLLLPHDPQSMLVSGGFFEAFGRVPLIVARASPFMRGMAAQHPNVLVYEQAEELGPLLQRLLHDWSAAPPPPSAELARSQFGWATCVRCYREALAPA
jgi:beta-1,4-mannosyltransferase